MSRLVEDAVARYLRDSCAALERAADDAQLRRSLAAIADRMTRTFRAGGKVLFGATQAQPEMAAGKRAS